MKRKDSIKNKTNSKKFWFIKQSFKIKLFEEVKSEGYFWLLLAIS